MHSTQVKTQYPQHSTKGKGQGNEKQKITNSGKEEKGNYWEKKTATKVYDLNSDKEINGVFGTVDHDDDSGNDNEDHILREKRQAIKNNKKNKPSSLTVK